MFPSRTKILVVDDVAAMRFVMKTTLLQLGFHNMYEADSGHSAWLQIEKAAKSEAPFELVLSDWNMPEMRGLDLLQKVRQSPMTAGLPFILVTAESQKDLIREALQSGASDYMIKPFTAGVLERSLQMVHRKLAA